MIHSIEGKLALKSDHFVVVETGGLGLKVAASEQTIAAMPAVGGPIKLFSYLHVREGAMDLYGFLGEKDLMFFEMLISVSGVGPKSALSILDVAPLDELAAAIKEGRPDLLTRASGIGRKTAERVIVELKTKVQSTKSGLVVEKMQTDVDLVEALASLGYRRDEARVALGKVAADVSGTENRLKAALAILSKK
jgi:Holliday junction DNA helicase RuvA